MPSKAASRHVDMTDLEDDLLNSELENVEQPAQPVINRTVIKKSTASKSRPGANQPKATAKGPAVAAKPAAKTKAQREALKDRTNLANASDTDEVDEFDEAEADADAEPAPAKPKARKSKSVKPKDVEETEVVAPAKKTSRGSKTKAAPPPAATRDEIPDSQVPTKIRKPKTTAAKRAASPERVPAIPETQAELEDVSQSIEEDQDAMEIDRVQSPPRVSKSVHRARSSSQQRQAPLQPVVQRARSTSIQPRNFSRSRAGSASDTERRMAESEAKKKLSEMTRKYEDMRMKYDSLQELAQNAAESNFDKLKKASDERAKDANNLISSLKREIAELRKTSSTATSEAARLQSQVATLQTDAEKSSEEARSASAALLEAQNEVKSLNAKLDAARKANQAPVNEKIPGSAAKGQNHMLGRSQMGGSGPEATKEAKLKEELYRDLTGLIINSVKRKDGEDEYSCIQTGRNGTLHFHLTISNDSAISNPKTPSGLSYEETEFAYEPLLDDNRDRDLIDILPDYLSEEICFPRNHAVKFYTKVVESMTRRVVVDEE